MAKRTNMNTKAKRHDRIVIGPVAGELVIVFENTAGTRVRIEADESDRYKIERAPVLVVKKTAEPRS